MDLKNQFEININNNVLGLQDKNILSLQNSYDESQIELMICNQKYHRNVYIKSYLQDKKVSILGKQLRHQVQLIELTLKIQRNSLKSKQSLICLAESIKYLLDLKRLTFQIEIQSTYFSFKQFGSQLGQGLEQLKNLEMFQFELYQSSLLEIEGASFLKKGLASLQRLSELYIFLQFQNTKDDDSILCQIFKGIDDLKLLKSFKIATCKQAESIKSFSFDLNLLNFINLQELKIQIGIGIHIYKQNLSKIQENLRNLKQLKILFFQLIYLLIPASDVQDLFDGFLQLESLEELEAEFCVQYERKQPFVLGNKVIKQSKIRKLSIFLQNGNLKNQLLIQFGNDIGNIKNIIDLKLEIFYFQFGIINQDTFLNWLASSINLERLQLNILDQVNQISLQQIGDSLSKLKKLNELQLNIPQNPNYKNDQLYLLKGISEIKNLEKLYLTDIFDQMNYNNLIIAQLNLVQLTNLKEIKFFQIQNKQSFEFFYIACPLYSFSQLVLLEITIDGAIDFQGIKQIGNGLSSLINLRVFRFIQQFQIKSEQYYIEYEDFLAIAQGIQNLKQLREIVFIIYLPQHLLQIYLQEFTKCIQELNQIIFIQLIPMQTEYLFEEISYRRVARKNIRLVSFKC